MSGTKATRNIVLYADDDPEDRELVLEAFKVYASRVEVLTVDNGIQALDYVQHVDEESDIPCLIILDINMPILNGKEVLMKLRQNQRFQSLPIVLFSTSTLPGDQAFAKRFGAGFVTKPLDGDQMQTITEIFIDYCADPIRKNIRRNL